MCFHKHLFRNQREHNTLSHTRYATEGQLYTKPVDMENIDFRDLYTV